MQLKHQKVPSPPAEDEQVNLQLTESNELPKIYDLDPTMKLFKLV